MTSTDFVNFLLQERGHVESVSLPATVRFNHAFTVVLSEGPRGELVLESPLDCDLSGSDPMLMGRLLQWNRLEYIVTGGAFALAENRETLLYRRSVDPRMLDYDQLQRIVDDFVVRVDKLGAALLADPLDVSSAFAEEPTPAEDVPGFGSMKA